MPGRSDHDSKIREIALCKDLIRQNIESLCDTGRLIGEMPDNQPAANDFTNVFDYLIALVDSIDTQAPDNTMLKNLYAARGWEYPEFQEFQEFLAERDGADLPAFLGQLAGSKVGNDYSRVSKMAPHRYSEWQRTGEAVYNLLFNTGCRSAAMTKALRAKIEAITGPYYSRRNCNELLPMLAQNLISIEDAEVLVAAGWTEAHNDQVYAALGDSRMFREGKGTRVSAVEVQAVEFNLSRLNACITAKANSATRSQREEMDGQALETRKAEAAVRLALQDKIRAGTVTAAEIDAAGY
ncbi:hypothetical protein [Pseudomonas syringae group genomosp. 7]|uniref:hypothetical protein n=1 Tax=Pseudomonas syringae group genomosp. 7 TaxID=251699 RepID=UPI000F00050B|nr:hypothetical protein [Pseudomonas syringae group genomosp. 7]RMR02765.1 hypothetical protein ALP93_00578 [Pseudomonas syringae pv. helianthi]